VHSERFYEAQKPAIHKAWRVFYCPVKYTKCIDMQPLMVVSSNSMELIPPCHLLILRKIRPAHSPWHNGSCPWATDKRGLAATPHTSPKIYVFMLWLYERQIPYIALLSFIWELPKLNPVADRF
jgi:hypothetical protein